MDYINRINKIDEIRTEMEKNSIPVNDKSLYLCIQKKDVFFKLTDNFKIEAKKKTIGSESVNGEVYRSCIGNNEMCIAIKQIPLDEPMPKNIYSKEARSRSLWIELLVMEVCNVIVKEGICPNLPISYGHYICDSCVFAKKKDNNCILHMSELADLGDGNEFFSKHYTKYTSEYGYEEVLAYILFQIYTALYSLQKYFNITHHDLHAGNILFKSTIDSQDEYIMYTIDGNNYYVKNLGFIVVLWDFGFAMAPNRLFNIENKKYYTNLKSVNDKKIIEDWIQVPRLSVDYKRITFNIFERVKHKMTEQLEELFSNTFNGFVNGVAINDILKYYRKYYAKRQKYVYKCSLDKFLKINDDLKPLMRVNKYKDELRNLKADTLVRYRYILEGNNIDVEIPHYQHFSEIN